MIDAVVARLRDQTTALRRVQPTTDLGAIIKQGDRTMLPCAHVYLASDQAAPNRLATAAVSQLVTRRIAVLLGVAAIGADREAGVIDQLEPTVAVVRAALVGWVPPEAAQPCTLVRGAFVDVVGGIAWWVEEYATSYYLRSV